MPESDDPIDEDTPDETSKLDFLRKISRKNWIIIGIAVLLIISGSTALATKPKHQTAPQPSVQTSQVSSKKTSVSCTSSSATGCNSQQSARAFDPSHGKCQGTGLVPLTSAPLPINQVGLVEPLGLVIGGHVTPIDHGYIFGIHGHQGSKTNEYPVLAPADGLIVDMTATARSGQDNFVDHAVTFSFTCTLSAHYLNMDSFDEHILKQSGEITSDKAWSGAIRVKAGEVIGHTGPHGIDIFVWNANLNLTGFVKPTQYLASEDWKTHTADPYEYFAEPIKSQLLAKNPRVVTPRGGKIDYDIDGRLIGSWFKEGSGGYTGGGHGGDGYWKGHLAIIPEAFDPSGIVVSIGDWNGQASQFGVIGAKPDPKDVSISSGVVKYELGMPNWVVASTGARWDSDSYQGPVRFEPTNSVQGVILLQMVGTSRLKLEEFPAKTASQVSGFTANAVFYER